MTINFKLKDIDKIIPAGDKNNLYLSWFWLTQLDGNGTAL